MDSSALPEQQFFLTGGRQKRCKPRAVTEKHGFPPLWFSNLYSGQPCSVWVRKSFQSVIGVGFPLLL